MVKLTYKDKEMLDSVLKNSEYFRRKLVEATGREQGPLFTYKELLYCIKSYKEELFKTRELNVMTNKRRFTNFVIFCLERNKANFDTMILLTGTKGGGKSSTAIQLSRAWCKLLGIRFSPARHIAYNNSDVMNKCDSLNKFEPLIADEAIRFASSENWNKAENKDLKMKLGQIRTKHLFYILCFPLNISKLDKTYLNDYVNYWIHLFVRGKGVLFIKDENVALDPWNLKALERIGSWNEFTEPAQIEKKLSTHPNYWTTVSIPKVPTPVYEQYLKVREYNVYNDDAVRRSLSKTDFYKAALLLALESIMTVDKTISMKRIVMHIRNNIGMDIDTRSISDILNDSRKLVEVYKNNAADFAKDPSKIAIEVKAEEYDNGTETAE